MFWAECDTWWAMYSLILTFFLHSIETQVGQQKTKGIDIFVNEDLDTRIARNFNNNPDCKEIKFQNFAYPGNKFDFHSDQNKVIFITACAPLSNVATIKKNYDKWM